MATRRGRTHASWTTATPDTLALLTILRTRGVALLGERRLTTATIGDAETLLSKSDLRTVMTLR